MKRSFIFLALTLISLASFAQKVSYGIIGGVNIGTIQAGAQGTGTTNTTDSHVSSVFAAYVDFHIWHFSLQPAIELTGKGGDITTGDGGVGQFALHYLEIPINLIYRVPLAGGEVYFGGGPYISFGTGGTLSVNGPGGVDSENVTFGGSGDFSNNDSGFDFLAGMKFKSGFLFRLNYDLGLDNILNSYGPEGGLGYFKTRTFGISAGYAF
jgi:hypothetical protein